MMQDRCKNSFDLDPFFLISETKPNRCVADLDPNAHHESEKIAWRIFPGHQRSRRLSPLDVIVPCKSPPDVIFTWMSDCLIQDKVKRIFENESLTGFATRTARAKTQETRVSIGVSELLITGWGGLAPPASGIREVERCEGCGYLGYSGIEEPQELIDPKNW